MAELSKIRKNGVDYDIKDEKAREAIEELKQNGTGGGTTTETITKTGVVVSIDADIGDEITVSADTAETVELYHSGINQLPSGIRLAYGSGMTATINADGTFTFSGTPTETCYFHYCLPDGDNFYLPPGTYTFNHFGFPTDAANALYLTIQTTDDSKPFDGEAAITVHGLNNGRQFTITDGATVRGFFGINKNYSGGDLTLGVMLGRNVTAYGEWVAPTLKKEKTMLPTTLTAHDGVNLIYTGGGDIINASISKSFADRVKEAMTPDYAAYGLPILHLTGDANPMSKDVAVDLKYVYGERSGTCSVKWQGSSSLAYAKKNYTIKFDNAFEASTGWGAQKKYCLKANYIDHSHSRNIVSAKLWGQIVKSRENVPERLKNLVNGGAIDGFPCIIMLNGEFHGLYTWNIPKDGWMLGMGDSNSAATQTGALVNIEAKEDTTLRVSADTAETVKLIHHGKNYFPGFVNDEYRVGITLTAHDDRTATFSGTNNGGATAYIDTHNPIEKGFFLPAGLYWLSGNVPNRSDGVAFYIINPGVGAVARIDKTIEGYRFRLDEGQVVTANFMIPSGVTVEGDVWIQIEAVETGGTATTFEPSQRIEMEATLPISVDALDGMNILYTTTGNVLTVNAGGNEYEAIVCASGNSADFAIEGFKQTVSEWDTGFDLEYIADESDESKAAAMQSLNNLITACINSDGTDLDTIGTMLDWDSAIDYYIFATMITGHDMQLKNYLLYTFNGTKWYFGAYDMDSTYGLHWNGGSWVASHYPARFDTLAIGHRLFELIKNYKKAEVKARYEVIKQNVMSENNVYLMFSNFIGKIPSHVYLEDTKRWPMIPNTSVNDINQILNYYRMRLSGCDIWVESQHR